jgi:hypothetical protein
MIPITIFLIVSFFKQNMKCDIHVRVSLSIAVTLWAPCIWRYKKITISIVLLFPNVSTLVFPNVPTLLFPGRTEQVDQVSYHVNQIINKKKEAKRKTNLQKNRTPVVPVPTQPLLSDDRSRPLA